MDQERRRLLASTALLGGVAAATHSAQAGSTEPSAPTRSLVVQPSRAGDMTAALQRTIDRAAALNLPLELSPGQYDIQGPVRLAPNSKLLGSYGLAVLNLVRGGHIMADNANEMALSGVTITGARNTRDASKDALVTLSNCTNLHLANVSIRNAPSSAVRLWRSSGSIEHCRFEHIGHTAVVSGDAAGLSISNNRITHAGNNGIVVWRQTAGPDSTSVTNNHIAHVRADADGSGQNGNAINAFRAGNVLISNNVISHCAYSAVRCNAASNAQVIANNCHTIGEVALYAEFGFEGAVIASNVVDGAATGIEVTNFREGGRLASVQGNLIRNLVRREHEPVDKRGVGIAVEADTVVNANTIENAATAGILIGWGKWLRHVSATGNLVRDAAVGIAVSVQGKPETSLIANNIISGARNGAVRLIDHDKIVGEPLQNGAGNNSPAILNGNLMS
jgi:uncharacterized secreted repeat protein (TIGR03808 family)